MNDELTFNPKDLFGFLIGRVVDLEAELTIQSALLKNLAIQSVGIDLSERLQVEAESFRQSIRLKLQHDLSEELKGISQEFGDYLEGLLNSE